MGLSHVAAAGIIFLSAGLAGFQISDDVFDHQDEVADAWIAFYELEQARSATEFTITKVLAGGGDTTKMEAVNTGSTPIDLTQLTLFYDGLPVTPLSWTVDGDAIDLWSPQTELWLYSDVWQNPDYAVLMDENGVKAYWRK